MYHGNPAYRIPVYSSGATTHKLQLEIPQSASTAGSFCDYDFQSLLKLHFSGVTLWMYFNRTRVLPASAQNSYCLRLVVTFILFV